MDIYLDTNLWNELFKQGVHPGSLLPSLKGEGKRLVLSDETVYELAKTFAKKGQSGLEKGIGLFTYLKEFITQSVPITKDNMAMVAAEMQALQWLMKEIFPFINPSDYEIVRTLVDHLSIGEIGDRELEHIDKRLAIRGFDRQRVIRFLEDNPDVRRDLLAVSRELFPPWLKREADTPNCIDYLAGQIHSYFPERPGEEASEYAFALQTATANRVSKGMIRRNIYINWRCAHRGSIPKDLFPDSSHVVNANFCDVYATKESGQAEYAWLLLTPSTCVRIYDAQKPIGEWLLSLT
jgi:hypothetical protein